MEYYSELCLPPDQLLAAPYGSEYAAGWLGTGAGEAGGEYAPRAALLADGGDRFSVNAVIFDKYEELVWMGNQGGHVTSYYGPAMQKYTSFQVHESEEVRHFATLEQGILALTKTSLRHQIRRGIPKHTHRSENMTDMQCLLQLSPHRMLMGGHQEQLLDLDLNKMKESVIVRQPEGCAVMRSSGGALVACGSASGALTLRDVRCPGRAVHSMQAHSACLSDLDIQGDLLITAGFTNGGGGVAMAEPYVVVWDVRKLRSGSPTDGAWSVPLPTAPLLLHFVPSVSGRAAAVAGTGEVMLFNVNTTDDDMQHSLFQVDTQSSLCTVFDISSTSQALVFGDQSGHLNLYSPQHNTEPIFNNFSRETEFADPVENIPFVSFSDETFQFSSLPMPPLTTGEKLFSDWPLEFSKKAYRKPKPIDPEILKSMKMQGPIGYAPNPRTSRRNELPYIEDTISGPDSPKHDDNHAMAQPIPKRYHKVEIRYSKHSSESEFDHYNKTGFPGLEATLPNSYCNAMLQVLYYTQPVKKTLLAHSCAKEFCLTCELGFLFRMLDTSSGAPCQASNFLRAFRTVPEATALGLILSDRLLHPKIDLVALIQSWNRFILHQMHFEILETRKKEKELVQLAQRSSPSKPTSRLGNIALNGSKVSARLAAAASGVNGQYEEDLDYSGETEFAEEAVENRREAEDWDRLNLMMQDDGSGDYTTQHPSEESLLLDRSSDREETEISELFGIRQVQLNRCLKCNKEEERKSVVLACALQYPSSAQNKSEPHKEPPGDFLTPLRAALASRKTTPAWCEACEKFSPTVQHGRVTRLPPILAINFGGVSALEKAYWKKGTLKENMEVPRRNSGAVGGSSKPCRYGLHCARPGCRFKHPERPGQYPSSQQTSSRTESQCFLPHFLHIQLQSDGEISVSDCPKESSSATDSDQECEYRLSACVVSVESRNLVSYIRMEGDQWYLFNDVSIVSVTSDEVIQFGGWWKSPCVLFYTSRGVESASASSGVAASGAENDSVFCADDMRSMHIASLPHTFTPLGPHEMPTPGTLVGMDAEFVTLNSEEVELRSDGQRSTLRPSHMSVARITCVRGQGPLEGVPFIDDYISTQEQVVDYLTKFSGIKPGDLDANFSSKHLTTLKSTYRKLRSLVDSGVVFVGHGLNNDFRVINLVVPPEQVIDTVQLFHLPHHRMVSLKFLAWHFLGLKIQSETHDSVEDARTALRLRHKWAELGAAGELRAALLRLYRAGDAANWRVQE